MGHSPSLIRWASTENDENRQWLRRRYLDAGLRWLRSCARCHSTVPPIDLLCDRCWPDLTAALNPPAKLLQVGYPFPVYSLLTWNDQNDSIVRPFIHAFKGGYAVRAAEYLLSVLTHGRAWRGTDPIVAFPPPSKSDADHAWTLAQVAARQWPTLTVRLESREKKQLSQKHRRAHERNERRFAEPEGASFSNQPVVFVDDVITTGSTAMAAYMALGDPDHFEVWSLVCRPKLAGPISL